MTGLPNLILRSAACLVPGEQRADWLAEWQSELCYLRRTEGRALRFCLGALPDALWMRRNLPRAAGRPIVRLDSPVHCLLFLAALAGASALLATRLPVARDLFLPFPYPDSRNLAMVTAAGRFEERLPTVAMEDYRSIANRIDAAFYKPISTRVSTGRRTAVLSVALASGNLFDLLGIAIPARAPALVLGRAAWRKHFGGDPQIGGRIVEVAGRSVPVAAVIADDLWRLPGSVDAWLIEEEANLSALPPLNQGFVIARTAAPHTSWRWDLFVPNREGRSKHFECAALGHGTPMWANFLCAGIALLVLPVVTSCKRGDYPRGAVSPWRWIFLTSKTALLVVMVYFATLDVASCVAMGLQPQALLIGYVVAFRWALNDQRRRCPVCLRLLTNPTRIGRPSQTFLSWWGTELMCSQGHGLLHVPEIPSSSSSSQRWLTFEQSWSSLFS